MNIENKTLLVGVKYQCTEDKKTDLVCYLLKSGDSRGFKKKTL